MTITQDLHGITVINADEGKALRRKTDKGPTRITRVALSATSSPADWTDCDYAATEDENMAEVIPAPRTWTPLSIKRACGARWPAVKAALQDADIYEDFIMAEELREGDEAFERGRSRAIAQYGEEVVEGVLQAAMEGA